MNDFKHYKELFISVNENRAIPVYKRHDNLSEYLEGGLMEVVQATAKDLEYYPSTNPQTIKHHLNNAVYVKATAKGKEVILTELYKVYDLKPTI